MRHRKTKSTETTLLSSVISMDELVVPSSDFLLEVMNDEEDFIDYEKNEEDEEEREESEEGDYSTDSEEEIQIESITDSNKMEMFANDTNVASMNNIEIVNSSQTPTTVYVDSDDTPTPRKALSNEAESRADEIASGLMTAQLAEYSWIRSTVPEEEIIEIVKRLKIKKVVYDYLPRVFYVDKEDFKDWLDNDGDDHFFKWVKGASRGRRAAGEDVAGGDAADEDSADEGSAGEDVAGEDVAGEDVA
ncbi:hypothetical protein BGZ76_001521, partial [Entomortierella beljakovae]